MAEGNAEIVRRLYRAFDEGDEEGAAELLDPQVEYINPPEAVEGGVRRGQNEWREGMRSVRRSFSEARIAVEKLVETGDRVATLVTVRVHGRGSGVDTEMRQSHLWTIRDGRAVRFEWSMDPDRAFVLLEQGQP